MENLCIFCQHFRWEAEYFEGMGSTMTGPMLSGGWAECRKGRLHGLNKPEDQDDYREVIMKGINCPDYTPLRKNPVNKEAPEEAEGSN